MRERSIFRGNEARTSKGVKLRPTAKYLLQCHVILFPPYSNIFNVLRLKRLRQSGIARNNNLKRKKKKRKESVTHVKQHSVDISALEDLLDETEVPVKEFSKTMPEKGRGKKGKGFRGKEMQPPEESAYRQSMRRATNVYV